MAGDWMKIELTTPDKPEIVLMAARLRIDQDAVVGKLFRIWAWADMNTVAGKAMPITEAFLGRLTNHKNFAAAMREAGWLQGEDMALIFPNFDRHNGTTAKTRADTNRRVAKSRAGRDKSNDPTVTDVTPSPLPKPLPEKRREERMDDTTRRERGPALPTSAEEVGTFAQSLPIPAPPEAATAFFDTMESTGWVSTQGHPIANWHAAFRRYLTRWIEIEKNQKTGGYTRPGTPAAKPPVPAKKSWE